MVAYMAELRSLEPLNFDCLLMYQGVYPCMLGNALVGKTTLDPLLLTMIEFAAQMY